jgi:hypothetical protein
MQLNDAKQEAIKSQQEMKEVCHHVHVQLPCPCHPTLISYSATPGQRHQAKFAGCEERPSEGGALVFFDALSPAHSPLAFLHLQAEANAKKAESQK